MFLLEYTHTVTVTEFMIQILFIGLLVLASLFVE